MIKLVANEVWAFDVEWVPDPVSGRRTYGLPDGMSDEDIVDLMWREGGATPDDPRPYLKTALCRIVSVAAIVRKKDRDGRVTLHLRSLPDPADHIADEADILARFLGGIGRSKPQIVGYNSTSADLKILLQRALVHRLRLQEFASRPSKPWEGVDYFVKNGDWHIDLRDELSGWGKAGPSLHEMATVCGIPGKIGVDGGSVVDLWRDGRIAEIVAYNECDAATTYLLWLRVAHLSGHITTAQFEAEEHELEALMAERSGTAPLLQTWLSAWSRLRT